MDIEDQNSPYQPGSSPSMWEMTVEWARAIGMVVAVIGLAVLVLSSGIDEPYGPPVFIAGWCGMLVYVAGSYALPDFRNRMGELVKKPLSKQFIAMWGLLRPPEAPSPRRIPRVLVASLAVFWVVLFLILWFSMLLSL